MKLHYGIVSATDPAAGKVRVTLTAMDNLPTDWLGVSQDFGTRTNKAFRLPDEGEQVICLLDNRSEEGVVLGSIYNSEDVPDPDNSGAGVYAVKLVQGAAAVFLAVVRRASAGMLSVWSKSSAKLETDTGNIELKAGAKMQLSSAGKFSVKAGAKDETLYALLRDIAKLLRDHKHIIAGPTTTVLQPPDLVKAADVLLRLETFLEA